MDEFKATISDLAKILAGDAGYEHFHGKLYSFIPPSRDQALTFLGGIKFEKDAFPSKHQAMMLVGDFSGVINARIQAVPIIREDKFAIHFVIEKLQLPKGDYFVLISPFSRAVGESSYAKAFQSIAFLRAYLSLFFGKLVHYNWVADFDFDVEGNISMPSSVIRRPMHADFFSIFDETLAREIVERLGVQLSDYRKRIQRACDLFDMALNQKDEAYRFASYWIALEVLVGSTGDGIRAKLAEAYGYGSNKTLVNTNLLFDKVSSVRGELIHKGEFRKIFSYQERLLQLYFWDIVICQLHLRHRGLARMLVTSGLVEEEVASE